MRSIPKEQWKAYCDSVTDALTGLRAEIEIASLDLGNQIEAEWLPVYGITYDHKDDLFEVALEGLDHLIQRPRELHAQEGSRSIDAILVIDQDSVRHLIRFREPLMLPPPAE